MFGFFRHPNLHLQRLHRKGRETKRKSYVSKNVRPLKLTANAPENGWLEYKPFLYWVSAYLGAKWLVSGRVP